jgi:hypothetical protein
MGPLRLATDRDGDEAGTVDRNRLGHPCPSRLGFKPVSRVENDPGPTPDPDFNRVAVASQCEQPFDPIVKRNEAREVEPFHAFEAACRTARGVVPAPGLVKRDEQRLEAEEVARLPQVRKDDCRLRADPGTLLEFESHGRGRVSSQSRSERSPS